MTWKREVTKFAKDTKLFKAVSMMEEPQGNWAIQWHLKISVDKMLSHAHSKTSRSFTSDGNCTGESLDTRGKILGF